MIITIGALLIGVVIGIIVAICKVYGYQVQRISYLEALKLFFKTRRVSFLQKILTKFLDFIIDIYLTVFRGTPLVVQIMIWAFVVFSGLDEVLVAVIGFGVNSGAYVSEIFRAGIMAVDKGQIEAGRSLGMSAGQTMFHIVMPQAFKNILPALSNEVIALLKDTSIVGYVAVVDITKAAAMVRARTFDAFVPLMFVAAFYLVVVIFLTHIQKFLERKMQASDRR